MRRSWAILAVVDEENSAELAARRSKSSVVGAPLVVGVSDIVSGRLGSTPCGHRLPRIEHGRLRPIVDIADGLVSGLP